ncbi:PKD domain-containing protein [Dysgonomonas sp. 521]|uniref:PKD domain-containing protein n=1 Tax=Dysgonomonas sp. 521 TaxID=2302932 RepID=UPI0013D14B46|nr:PKD domain-containing protein [Dysgonomonas sp. 521]NDV97116.1 PKD domain-containing protein [Dysgonomonas sp. 521]
MKKLYILLFLLSLIGMNKVYAQVEITGATAFCMGTDNTFRYQGTVDASYAGTLKSTVWDFGDGTTQTIPLTVSGTSVSAQTSHKYTERGYHTITVKVLDTSNGEVSDLQQALLVRVNSCAVPVNHIPVYKGNTNGPKPCPPPTVPVIVFSPNPVNISVGNTFTATVTPKAGETYAWSVSNSGTNGLSIEGVTAGNTITIRSSKAGTFNANDIKVTATNSCGSTDGYGSGNITVSGPCPVPAIPVIVLNPDPVKVNRNGTFTASISSPESGVTYSWEILDGATNGLTIPGAISGNSVTIRATKSGSFNANAIRVIAINSCGDTQGQGSGTITVNNCEAAPTPTITFNPSPVIIDQNGTFTATVSVSDPTGVTYKWTISPTGLAQGLSIDASSSDTDSSIRIKGATVGTINANVISVTATNECGTGTATGNGNITVNDCLPVNRAIAFSPSPVVIDINNTFIASVTILSGETVSWSIVNAATNGLTIQGSNTGSSVTIKGTKSGIFNASDIKVTITNSCGSRTISGTGTITVNNCLLPVPTVTLISTSILKGNTFKAIVTATNGPITGYQWKLTDTSNNGFSIQGSSTGATVTILTSKSGTFDASKLSVTVTNACGTGTATATGYISVTDPGELVVDGDALIEGPTCYDIAQSNFNATCGLQASRTPAFPTAAKRIRTYYLSFGQQGGFGTLSNMKVGVSNDTYGIIKSVTGDKSGTLSNLETFTVTFADDINKLALGTTSANPRKATIWASYTEDGVRKRVELTIDVQDCACCPNGIIVNNGAYVGPANDMVAFNGVPGTNYSDNTIMTYFSQMSNAALCIHPTSSGITSWTGAVSYCANLPTAGEWRLPNIGELININIKRPGTISPTVRLWASTIATKGSAGNAWYVLFAYDMSYNTITSTYVNNKPSTYSLSARCVKTIGQ